MEGMSTHSVMAIVALRLEHQHGLQVIPVKNVLDV